MTLRFSVFVAGRFYAATTEACKLQGLYEAAFLRGVPSVTVEVIA